MAELVDYGVGMRATEYGETLARRGRREQTALRAAQTVRRCSDVLLEMGVDDPGEVSEEDVAMLADRLLETLKEGTVKQYVTTLGAYLRWVTGRNPVAQADLLWNRVEDIRRTWITADEYRTLMGRAQPRERLVMALAATMGLRRAEIVSLELDDFESGSVRIRGKGHGPQGKVVWKEVTEAVRKEMDAYMKVRPETESRALLVGAWGRPLSRYTVY